MPEASITIRPWSRPDGRLLERLLRDPAMTRYLGGPESTVAIGQRHERYCKFTDTGPGCMFVVVADGEDAGSVGYWEQRWNGEDIWEMGWSILPEHQGRGLATAAAALVIERTRKDGRFRYVHAFPSIENRASNAICRKLGFESQGTVDFEYPVGNPMKSIDWRFDLLDLQQRPIRE